MEIWSEEISKKEKLIIGGVLLITGIILSWLMYDFVYIAPIFLALYIPGKNKYIYYLNEKTKNNLEIQFNDFLYYASIGFSMGRTMIQAIREAKANLLDIYGEKCILGGFLEDILRNYEESNSSELLLLNSFAEKTKNEDIKDFVDVYENCKETGGDMIYAINGASKVISEKITITREIKSIYSQKKLEGRIIAVMPFLIILFLRLTGPDYLQILYSSLAGRIIMTLTLISVGISWILVDKITKVKI